MTAIISSRNQKPECPLANQFPVELNPKHFFRQHMRFISSCAGTMVDKAGLDANHQSTTMSQRINQVPKHYC